MYENRMAVLPGEIPLVKPVCCKQKIAQTAKQKGDDNNK